MGDDVKINCYSKQSPQWLRNDRPLSFILEPTKILILNNVKMEDTGNYSCEGVRDSLGTIFIDNAEVLVGGKLLF